MLGKFVIAGFEVFIGLAFILFGATISFYHYPTLGIVVFFVGVASFAGIPVLRKSSAKGIKLFMIISVVQIGTIIYCHIAKTPGMGGSPIELDSGGEGGGLTFLLGLSIFVLAILVYFYSKKRQHFH